MASLCPAVRELKPGERPHDWANDFRVNIAGTSDAGTSDAGTSDAGTSDAGTSDAGTSDAGETEGPELDAKSRNGDRADDGASLPPFPAAPARRELPPLTGPQQYQMQLCTTEECGFRTMTDT